MASISVASSAGLQPKRPLLGLLIAQFVGAFNDNAWKLIVFTLATRLIAPTEDNFESESQYQASLGFILFLFPMLLFSLPAGALADRISKRTVLIATKALELFLLTIATACLFFLPQNLIIPYVILALMGMQSALFSPAKYGIMPELLPEEKLSQGNGLLETWTMLAIIGGTGFGPMFMIADQEGTRPGMTWLAPFWLLLLSLIGFMVSFRVPKIQQSRKDRNGVFTSILKAWKTINTDNILFLAIVGSAFYWFIISLLGQNVLVYAKWLVQNLQKGEVLQGLPPASYGIGIALGALTAGKLSGDKIEYGLIPLGAVGFAFTSLLLGFIQPGMPGTVVILITMGTFSGMVIVPLHSIIQWRSPNDRRGGIIGIGNILDISGMIIGSLLAAGMAWIGIKLGMMLVVSSFLVCCATLWAVQLLPDALLRLMFILLTCTFYRIRTIGTEHLPKKGPALLVSNHMTIVDALFVLATAGRPVRFLMKENFYNKWWIYPIAKIMQAIPYSGNVPGKDEGIQKARESLEKGCLVCIFPEGQVSKTKMMLPFSQDIEILMTGRRCPIIPMHLDLVWGGALSFEGARYFTKIPHQIPYPLTVTFGNSLPPETSVSKIRQKIQELGCEAWTIRKQHAEMAHRLFIRQARWKPWKTLLVDQWNGKISRFRTLTESIELARILRGQWKREENIGILLPPSVVGVYSNLAVSIACYTAVNLNFSIGIQGIKAALEQAEIKTILTSRAFYEKFKSLIPESSKVIFVEELLKKVGSCQKFIAQLIGLFAPLRMVEKYCGGVKQRKLDDPLTIVFSSGSTGTPKGVVLSHFNIVSNVEAVSQVIPSLAPQDKLLVALPFYHSFGYMQMWLGLNHDFELILHQNPLDANGIGQLILTHKISIMMTTPTFLRIYLQKALPEQFGSLQCVLTGAEKLSKKLAEQFEDRFGIRPIEGYGVTECSPVIATSVPDVRKAGIFQAGSQRGTVGHPLPGVIVKVIHPETFEEMSNGLEGMLLVKGPNVMKEYLKRPDLTAKSMNGDWYITGDIASIDSDGFIRIIDKAARFSKVGGEMVPHVTVEEALHQAANIEEISFAVTAIPDESKGECLVVLHRIEECLLEEVILKLQRLGLPNLFIPKLDNFIKVEELPLLSSGKPDLIAMKNIALKKVKEA
jgi:acyl-[acyl-carrier-protein]-phospholipid O-acyltransferase/long-chain-fatty-acid--[acyl-carrier-protein] ligase